MPIELLSSPTVLRRHLKRLIKDAERIDVFLSGLSDSDFTRLLVEAAARGAEVNVTTNLDASTCPDALEAVRAAGGFVGEFAPSTHRRRQVLRFEPGVLVFDNEEAWWTAAIVGSFSGTEASLAQHLWAATLFESSVFDGSDEAGDLLLQILNWGDSINHEPLTARRQTWHRKLYETAHASRRAGRLVEPKPMGMRVSPVSWQELRRCSWGTYWHALLEVDKQERPRGAADLFGPKGWLFGINTAQAAFRSGTDGWVEEELRSSLLGQDRATRVLGRVTGGALPRLVAEDAVFRRALYDAVERCVTDSSASAMLTALLPVVTDYGVSVAELSRILTAAAPDRFFSILDQSTRVRVSDMAGFDVAAPGCDAGDRLRRYIEAIEQTRSFPWAAERSSERSSDHPRESEAWSQRMGLVGCLVG